ncbi:thermonuclease family protein [Cohnella candidum]|uniref:Nuclease n=1 Tax=Cohnella candidum TaxID=2674991 RepID=A0A3G3K4Q7_9BACL|nr:thermonuclease family protein [Cohnella candidum]AYQ75494.1 nuclease [Cohnella candidum]
MGRTKRTVVAACLWLTAVVCALAGCGAKTAPADAGTDIGKIISRYPELQADRAEQGTVKRVVDGDTFELESGDKVRLIGVNTPEIHGKVERYGQEAADFSGNALTGRRVILFPDVSNTDKYGRLLRYVFVAGDDEMFNEKLMREGYAQVMTVPPNVGFADSFVSLQREARAKGAGLWGGAAGNAGKETTAPESSADSAPPACPNPIKGNINAKGEKIYHVPGGSSYRATKPEKWFCTEQEALDAGFRKAAR